MYRGFKLKISKESFFESCKDYEYYHNKGLDLYQKQEVRRSISQYANPRSGIIDGTKLQEDWFPTINDCDIFISHSHNDEDRAIALAGWLFENFELKSFIDSCIWGYADDLLREIDDMYCKRNNKCDYKLRNYSTSHVHMMLNMALMKMIDKTECLFFLNTPNSIRLSDIKTQTLSPWIYSEIGISQMIEKHRPKKILTESFDKRALNMSYDLDLSHLAEIDEQDLLDWSKSYIGKKGPLNKLYEIIDNKQC